MKKHYLIILLTLLAMSSFCQTKGLNFAKSLVLPGYSQITNGKSYGYAMLAGEVAIIGSMLYLKTEQRLSKQESYEYAIEFAHIRPGYYDEVYFSHLSRYDSSGFGGGGYNAMIRQKAIQNYPDDPVMQQQYIDANIYSNDMAWNWDASSKRGDYSKMRIHTQDLKDFASIATGVLILNHFVSGFDALRISNDVKANLSLGLKEHQPLLRLDVTF